MLANRITVLPIAVMQKCYDKLKKYCNPKANIDMNFFREFRVSCHSKMWLNIMRGIKEHLSAADKYKDHPAHFEWMSNKTSPIMCHWWRGKASYCYQVHHENTKRNFEVNLATFNKCCKQFIII